MLGDRLTRWIGARAARGSRRAQGGVDGYDGCSEDWLQAAQNYTAARSLEGNTITVLGHGHWLGWWPSGLICLGDWFAHDSYLRVEDDGTTGLWGYRESGDVLLLDTPSGAVPRA